MIIDTIKQILDKKTRARYFAAVNRLQKIIFIVYVNRDYAARRNFYEKKLHAARLQLMKVMKQVRQVLVVDEVGRCERLYEILFSLNNLKLRVNDHASFEIADREFRSLIVSLQKIFVDIARGKKSSLDELQAIIDELDVVNQTALQVVSFDPIVFMFFLRDLSALQQCLAEWIKT